VISLTHPNTHTQSIRFASGQAGTACRNRQD